MVGCGDDEDKERAEAAVSELWNVQLAVTALLMEPDPPITNLATDERIIDFQTDEKNPTNDMTNGGLITTVSGSYWDSVAGWWAYDTAQHYYIIDASGKVRGFYEKTGKRK